MAVGDLEKELLARLSGENRGRVIKRVRGSRWGRLIHPAPEEADKRPGQGVGVLFIGSWTLGLLALEALVALEAEMPGGFRLVGMVTDDPLDADAKISMKKRFWRYYEPHEREEYEWALLHRALPLGIPCYTGEVKCDAFRELMAQWNPDAIVVAAFGQVIDPSIISFPRQGIYNVHPSDLLGGYGAGPQPWEDLVERKAPVNRVTLHRVSPGLDEGDVVGRSPEINVLLPDGSHCADVRLIGEKSLVPVRPMVRELGLALVKRYVLGLTGFVESLDFHSVFGHRFKARLMEPLDPGKHGHILPLPEEEERYTV